MKPIEVIQRDIDGSTHKKPEHEMFKHAKLLVQHYTEEAITAEYLRVCEQIKLHKARLESAAAIINGSSETKSEIRRLSAKKKIFEYLLN